MVFLFLFSQLDKLPKKPDPRNGDFHPGLRKSHFLTAHNVITSTRMALCRPGFCIYRPTTPAPVLLSYVNTKVEKLDSRQTLTNKIAKLTAEAVSPEQIDTISNYLDDWVNVSFEDKQQVVDWMITVIRATSEKLKIEWKIQRQAYRQANVFLCPCPIYIGIHYLKSVKEFCHWHQTFDS